jgi:hypothetical protein
VAAWVCFGTIIQRSKFYLIDAIVTEDGKDPWRITGVYGAAQTSERFKT